MLSWKKIDSVTVQDGGELSLERRGDDFALRIDGQELMNSRSHGSEEALAVHGCAGLAARKRARVLVGGLGMGFTTRAALDVLAADARIEVVELALAVIRWNREHCGHLAGHPLGDPRVRAVAGDVADTIAASRRRWDAILLDADNGPTALTTRGNARLYSSEGLARAGHALRPGGTLALWSASDDRGTTTRMRDAGYSVQVKHVLAARGGTKRHVVWLARTRA